MLTVRTVAAAILCATAMGEGLHNASGTPAIANNNKLPSTGPLTLDHLLSLRSLLGSAEVEEAMGYSKLKPGEPDKFVYDYTNILRYYYEQFESNKLQPYVEDHPVLCFDMDLHFSQLGNRLGNFFEAMSFAQLQGLHFVSFSLHSHQAMATALTDSYMPLNNPFVRALPTVILHPNPVKSRSQVAKMLGTAYGAQQKNPWPWQEKNASWLYNVDVIGKAMRTSIGAYMAEAHKSPAVAPANTFHHPKDHRHNHRHNHTSGDIALIPDVAILLRCSDIVLHGGNEYGFLNFNTYPKLITGNKPPKEIYILSEPLKYGPWTDTCLNITRALVAFLSPRFPETTILVRRGFVMDALATFALAPTVICAPSTFCFWPALTNPSQVHFAVSPLINGGLAPRLKEGFHWISEPKLMGFWKQSLYDLRWPNSTEYILEKLTSINPPIAFDGGYVY